MSDDDWIARLIASLAILTPPPGWVDRASRRYERNRAMNTAHYVVCHDLIHGPRGAGVNLAGAIGRYTLDEARDVADRLGRCTRSPIAGQPPDILFRPLPGALTPIGFWRGNGEDPALPDPAEHIVEVDRARRLALAGILTTGSVGARYRGVAPCRMCKRALGSSDMWGHGYIWPQGLEHYILDHGVWPPGAGDLLAAAGVPA
jgi:hypothetical protein